MLGIGDTKALDKFYRLAIIYYNLLALKAYFTANY